MEGKGSNEAELLAKAQAGDTQAFGELYDRYFDEIYRFLNAQVWRSEDAEDLAIEAFTRAWEYLPRYRDRGHSFSAFLYSVARNALIDHYRRRKTRAGLEVEADDAFPDTADLPEDQILLQRQRRELINALSDLPPDYRQVLVLRFINEEPLEDIARILRRSEGAVRVLQHRALKALRKILEATSAQELVE
ncbi:MAG: RNA polymerase sigma factor [Chloroflexi bacterium]|nr:RNA polymerase sigma factor [Chloroflexota bacterium]